MNTFIFDGSWNQIKGVLRQKFAQLTDMDVEFIQGKGEELLGRLQTKLGLNEVELELLLDNIKASIASGTQAAQDKMADVKSKVSEMTGEWREKAGELYEEGRRKAVSLAEIGEDQFRRKPREALLAALLGGFVIGLMIRRP